MINMPKRKNNTNLTTGKKHMRMRRSRPGLVPQMSCNTEIFEDGPIGNYPEE